MFSHFLTRCIALNCLAACLPILAQSAQAQPPNKSELALALEAANDRDELILKHFKQPTDTAALLAYFRDRSASDDDLLAIPQLIKQFNNDPFAERVDAKRRLIALGLPVVLPLRDALSDSNPEIARFAKMTLESMNLGTNTIAIPQCAFRILIRRNPPELISTLLRYLPFTTDHELSDDICYLINNLTPNGSVVHPALVRALGDRHPKRRELAGCMVARAGTPEQKVLARKLLADPDTSVRLRTAQGFLASAETTGILTLIDLLDTRPVSTAWQAEELLVWTAGKNAPAPRLWAGGERAEKAKTAWKKWWDDNQGKVDLNDVVKHVHRPRLFFARFDNNYKLHGIFLIGSDGSFRWNFDDELRQPLGIQWARDDLFCVRQLDYRGTPDPNDSLMLYVRCHRLAEVDIEGKSKWAHRWDDGSFPLVRKRLPNFCFISAGPGNIRAIDILGRNSVIPPNTIRVDPLPVVNSDGLLRCVELDGGSQNTAAHEAGIEVDLGSGEIVRHFIWRLAHRNSILQSKGTMFQFWPRPKTLVFDSDLHEVRTTTAELEGIAWVLRNNYVLTIMGEKDRVKDRVIEYSPNGTRSAEIVSPMFLGFIEPCFALTELGFSVIQIQSRK